MTFSMISLNSFQFITFAVFAFGQMTYSNSATKKLPFPDIQSLCSYLFDKSWEDIHKNEESRGNEKDESFVSARNKSKQLAECFDVKAEVLEQVVNRRNKGISHIV